MPHNQERDVTFFALISKVGGFAFLKVANVGLAFLVSVVLARNLSPTGYGEYAFVLSIISSITMLACMGIPQLLVREIARYQSRTELSLSKGIMETASKFTISLSSLLMAALILISFYLYESDRAMARKVIMAAPLIPLICMIQIKSAVLRGLRFPLMASFPEMLVKPALMVITVYVIKELGLLSTQNAILAQVIATLIAFTVLSVNLSIHKGKKFATVRPDRQIERWFAAAPSFFGISLVSYLNVEFITLFLGLVSSSPSEIAMYRTAASLAMIVALPLTAVEAVIAPYITKFYFEGDIAKLEHFTQSSSLMALIASAVPAGVLIVFGEQLIEFFYGSEYISAYKPMVIMIVGYTLVNLVGLSMLLLYSTEFQATAFRLAAVGSVITLLLCMITVAKYGALGAAFALSFGKFSRAVLFAYFSRKKIGAKTSVII